MLSIGSLLANRYEILELIGSGGMADVYKAKDGALGRQVAVKVLKKEYTSDQTFVKKFKDEAQAAAGLSHPNIVSIYDVGEENGVFYIILELISGITLKKYIDRKGKLSIREATSIAIQVAMGLEAAHAQKIAHRDIKPANIMISMEGKVKVTDFGIAKVTTSNTINANHMGSVHYCSPEQARGGYSDEKSDIYSLGITMYEMVTGEVPFDGDSTVNIALKHLQEEMPEPKMVDPEIPFALNQIIMKCTQKYSDRRYGNMTELLLDLKKSLLEPNGKFVSFAPVAMDGDTNVISDDELAKIKQGLETGKSPSANVIVPATSIEADEEDDDDYEDEDDDEASGIDKALTIGGIIVFILILGLIAFFVIQATGILKFSNPFANKNKEVTTSSVKSELVKVPSLSGMTIQEATEAVKDLDLTIYQERHESSETIEKGKIISQNPNASVEVRRNTTINVVISSGKEDDEGVLIPTVTGMDQETATSLLVAAGFNVNIAYEASESIGKDLAIGTLPAAGDKLVSGSAITLKMSSGKGLENVDVPDVVGMAENEAARAIQGAGLVYEGSSKENSTDIEEGKVIRQSVAAGTNVASSTGVSIVVSAGKNETSNDNATWRSYTQVSQPPGYVEGSLLKITLTQGNTTTTLVDGEQVTFPYVVGAQGISGMDTGVVTISQQQTDGSYAQLGSYSIDFMKDE